MDELDIASIKKRTLSGIIALTSRTFLLQLIAFISTFLLTILISPSIFGIFYVVSAVISFLGYFSDIGLAAALIQKKEKLTQEDLSTTFTIQQLLVGTVVILMFVLSGFIADFYRLDKSGLWLLRALIVAFFMSSLKTIPSILLERALDFKKLIIPQIMETLGFYVVAVVLAWFGFGIASFTWAVLVRALIGLFIMYVISPWKISFGISSIVAKRLLRFGIPFQINSLLALVKDDLLTIVLGKVLPFTALGYIGWAKKWAEVPLRLIMDNMVRVTFPAFSRIQHSSEILGKAIEKTLFGVSLAVFPLSVGMIAFIRPIVSVIPKYSKWEPALFSFYLFVLTSMVASVSTPLTNALNAIGKIKITLYLMVTWTISTWVLTLLCIRWFGFNGVSIAMLLITVTIFLVVYLVKQYVRFSFLLSIRGPSIAAMCQGLYYWIFLGQVSGSWVRNVWLGVTGVILYGGVLWLIEKHRIIELIHQFHEYK